MCTKKKAAAILAIITIDDDEEDMRPSRKKPCHWMRPWIARRYEQGCHENLLKELLLEDQDSFRRYLRMDEEAYCKILTSISPLIEKQNTNWRLALTPSEKLSTTLRFLATGESQWSLSTQFRIGQSTISKFLIEVCKAIFESLRSEYMAVPKHPDEWKNISKDYEEKWNLPHCVGAIDGKHIQIKCPSNSGSMYFNYKEYYSIVLMAVVSADLKFIYIDVGTPGRGSDGGTWDRCSLNSALKDGRLHLPEPEIIFLMPLRPEQSRSSTASAMEVSQPKTPYFFVGDEGFPLKSNIMRPFSSHNLDDGKRVFNYRLSRARRTSENAFGLLANNWRIFHTPIDMQPEKVEFVVLAACVLHNFLLNQKSCTNQSLFGLADTEDEFGNLTSGEWRNNPANFLLENERLPPQRFENIAIEVRNDLTRYLNGPGAVPWQNKYKLWN